MAKKKRENPAPSTTSFEEALAELEAVVHSLEQGDLPLAESLRQYELGVKRLRECQKILEQTEQRIEILMRVDAEGNAVTRTLEVSGNSDIGDTASREAPRANSAPRRHVTHGPELEVRDESEASFCEDESDAADEIDEFRPDWEELGEDDKRGGSLF